MDPTEPLPGRPGAGARTVKVPEDRDGQRLDNFLLGQLKGAPRSLVYKLVRSGQVRVNDAGNAPERSPCLEDEPPVSDETAPDAEAAPEPGGWLAP